ncbi:14889_t:CDS:2 [Gigaspora margarita]|uniref:14889_t:CDS:1 n=1 Tax=Gigaspora margarita TaxID=4874 RepID=A0ABN7WAY6_GIGMA|nr:14889_t:CDS:2 [Gigaspora margarita]
MSMTVLIEANLDKMIEVQKDYACLNNAKFEEIINTISDFLTTQEENINNINYANENNAANELSEDEVDINNTNKEVEIFFADYAIKNSFTVKKYRMGCTKTEAIYKRTFSYEFSRKYKPYYSFLWPNNSQISAYHICDNCKEHEKDAYDMCDIIVEALQLVKL